MSALSFTTITLSRIHYIAEEETYSRLVTYSTLFNSNNLGTSDDIVDFRDMEVAFVKYEESEFVFSQDIKSYINEADFNRILEIVDSNLSKVYITNKITISPMKPIVLLKIKNIIIISISYKTYIIFIINIIIF